MGGKVLEYEAKTIRREGIAQGRAEERENGIRDTVSILKKTWHPTADNPGKNPGTVPFEHRSL